MKLFQLILSCLVLVSCQGSRFKGEKRFDDGPAVAPSPEEEPQKLTPVTGEDDEIEDLPPTDSKKPENPKKDPVQSPPPATRVLTLTVVKLKHDALFKNCLTIVVLGKSYRITCNKDFAQTQPTLITLPNNVTCVPLQIRMETFQPTDTDDCIEKIQANRDQHQCDYQSTPYRIASYPNTLRFQSKVLLQDGPRIKSLNIAFEDSQDADFDDYQFSLTSGNDSYIANKASGVESCIVP